MDLRIDPVQEQLADAVDAALGRSTDVHAELAAVGVPELGLPERLGGFGLGLSADVVVNHRLGRNLQPLPAHRETVFALELLPDGAAPEPFLERVLKGAAHATTIGVHTTPTLRADHEGAIWGDSEHLPAGDLALAVLRAVAPGGDTRWYRVPLGGAAAVSRDSALLGVAGQRVHFTGAPATPVEVDDGRWRTALDAARTRQAAVLLGIAEHALDTARSHVNRRIQFDEPLVRRQTVAHRLARLVGLADGWWLLLHEAAWRHDRGVGRAADAAQVLATAAEHALLSTRLALQLHGVRGMLAHSAAATAYRLASVEATRMGAVGRLWREAGAAHLAAPHAAPGLGE